MTTQEIANRYYELASQNKWEEILNELHDENVLCQEPEHAALRGVQVITKGREAIKAKGRANRERIEAIHSQHCSEPLVAGNFFTVVLKREVTFKNMPRMNAEELCVFEVKDGKIISEQFFY
jgi:hypothetical protein